MSWISLHTHSQYSILDSTASTKALVAKASEYGMQSLALTDFCNLFGAVEFFKAAKASGIKPIIGCEIIVAPNSRFDKKKPVGRAIVLLAKNAKGYQNLCKLSSLGYVEGFYYTPRIDKELLKEHSEGLICLSGSAVSGPIGTLIQQGSESALLEEINWYKELFGDDFYFELQRHQMSDEAIAASGIDKESWLYQNYLDYVSHQENVVKQLIELSNEHDIKCVATNDIHYIDEGDWKAHEILMNVQSGETCYIWDRDARGEIKGRVSNPKRKVKPTHALYFKSPDEMATLFADVPDAVAQTGLIADKCNFEFDFNKQHYPVFVPPHLENTEYTEEARACAAELYLKELSEKNIARRYGEAELLEVGKQYPDKDPMDVIKERLKYELDVITSKGMCDYLLIVNDFIAWAKGENIPVGPGRGSGAGSIILYLIGVTDIEPLRFNLFFERFINPERLSYPDIDVDICMERRSEVIDYTIKKYGKDKVAQIITFGTMKAKMAIRDVGRVLNVPLAKVNDIAKLVPEDPGMTLEKAFSLDPDLATLYEEDAEAKEILDFSRKVEGSIRNTGIHAAGLIVSANPLTDHVPVCTTKDAHLLATQFSMKPVEAVGMLKIDFLGLKTLTSIQKAVDAIKLHRGIDIDWVNLPLSDKATFNLLNQGKTLGTFQLESAGMQSLAKQLHIDKFEEIIAVGALYRPGPMEMIPSFINRKHGREAIEIDHPDMENVLAETYGIMVYQEQVMQIASLLAGYSLGEGDMLRRAMGKKDKAEMDRQKKKFTEGAVEKGIAKELAQMIFEKIEKFASYGFNKSHAAAYGYLSYVTAYLKANFPSEWMAALMTCDMDDLTKVAKHIRESQAMQIPILTPDVNISEAYFVGTDSGIRFAMSGIKGVGRGCVESIVLERNTNGPFESLFDFVKRLDTKSVSKKVVQSLIDAGAFDSMGWTRAQMQSALPDMLSSAGRAQKEAKQGIIDFFHMIEPEEKSAFKEPPQNVQPLPKAQALRLEKELMGFYLTGHPLEEYKKRLQELSAVPFHEVVTGSASVYRIGGIIETAKVRTSAKSGRKFAILNVSDGNENIEVSLWPALYEKHSEVIEENRLLYGVIRVDREDGRTRMSLRWLSDLMDVDDAALALCDAEYDKAKRMVKFDQYKGGKEKVEKKIEVKPLHLTLDLDQMKMSHVLDLKKYFHQFSGKTPIKVIFNSKQQGIGALDIAADWGVELDPKLHAALSAMPFVLECRV